MVYEMAFVPVGMHSTYCFLFLSHVFHVNTVLCRYILRTQFFRTICNRLPEPIVFCTIPEYGTYLRQKKVVARESYSFARLRFLTLVVQE